MRAYSDELDEKNGLNGYEFAIIMPNEFPGKSKAWAEKRQASQVSCHQDCPRYTVPKRILTSKRVNLLWGAARSHQMLTHRAPCCQTFAAERCKLLLITSTQISSIHPQYGPSLRTRIVIISRHVRSRGVDELKMLLLMPQKFNIPTLKIRCLLETFG